jgi:hypothetical protein
VTTWSGQGGNVWTLSPGSARIRFTSMGPLLDGGLSCAILSHGIGQQSLMLIHLLECNNISALVLVESADCQPVEQGNITPERGIGVEGRLPVE